MDNTINKRKTILIVDDEKPIVDILAYNLQKEGYNTLEAYDGETAIKKAFGYKPDLILLDIMLPKLDGLTVCKRIRTSYNIPIIMLSAKDEEIDKILGLEFGADDYITKPFSVRELIARVKANLRKNGEMVSVNQERKNPDETKPNNSDKKESDIITIGQLTMDLGRLIATVRGKEVDLTLREFDVLKYLAKEPGQIISREALLEEVWGYEYYGDIRTVDVTVRRIREKIELDTTNPQILKTKRGLGYYIPKE